MHQYLAVAAIGLESLLEQELTQLGVKNVKAVQAGVMFKADLATAYRVCLWTRLASRVVRVISEFDVSDDLDLYLSSASVNWSGLFAAQKTFVVDFNGTNKAIRNSQYGAVKVKDAIIDHFTKRDMARPSIDKDQPDLRVHVRLWREKALLGIDLAGEGLHVRGYRRKSGAAPLRETLTAALLMRSGWQADQALIDPMCGSGTIVIEAAMMAANIAPGLKRARWAFESLNDYDESAWLEIKSEASVAAKRGIKRVDVPLIGQDIDSNMVKLAQENARRAGVEDIVQFSVGDCTQISRPSAIESGWIVSNPPYGERLSSEPALMAMYTTFGQQLKAEFNGFNAAIFSSSDELLSCLRMRAEKSYKFKNGALACQLKRYSITAKVEQNSDTVTPFAPDFVNRLKKNITKIAKWANKEGIDCYRIYDADLPEYNAAIDVYHDHVVIQEYAAPKTIAPEKAKRRITDMIQGTIIATGTDANRVILKVREKQKGRAQYQKVADHAQRMKVGEYGAQLWVNLHDYLDTGLFLDHRLTRKRLGEMAQGKDFLNLFAYTGSATVHAANGGARSTLTVDMSKTYLQWAKDNMALNGHSGRAHQFEQADCLQWLKTARQTFDLIFIDPPTFSNSKRMAETFDVQRDHVTLFENLKRLLRENGVIVFSNNKRHFKMDLDALGELGLQAENISAKTLPLDFQRNKHIHNCWIVTHRA